MNAPLFRHEVIEAKRERLAGTVVAATPPRARVYLGLVLAVCAVLVLILILGEYATRASARGIVAFDRGIARVYSNTPGEIRQIHVRPGDRVEAGTPLVTIALAQGQGGMTAQLDQLTRQDDALRTQQDAAVAVAEAEARTLAGQRDSLNASIQALQRQRDLARAQVRLAQAAQRRAAQLAAEGAGTRRQAEESRAAVLARQAEVETLTERLATQQQSLRAIEAGISERRLEGERRRAEIAVQRAGLGEQRIALARSDTLVLTAPVAGTVGDIAGEIGQRARPDAAIVTLVPLDSRTEVWAYANSAAIGQVRPGQEVRLQFDAFPHQRHGSGRGRVVDIAPVPVDPASLDPALGIQEPVFRIRVAIEELPQRLPGGMQSLRPGTPVTANLILNRRSLWDVLFNPVKAAFEQ